MDKNRRYSIILIAVLVVVFIWGFTLSTLRTHSGNSSQTHLTNVEKL